MLTLLIRLSSSVVKVMPGIRETSSPTFWVGSTPHSSSAVTFFTLRALRCSVMASDWPSRTVATVKRSITTAWEGFISTSTRAVSPARTVTVTRRSSKDV